MSMQQHQPKLKQGIQVDDVSYPPVSGSPPPRKLLSHLPLFRYTTATIIIITIDSLLSISLWIAGGNSKYLEESVEDFSIYKSTFDLAVIAGFRGLVLIGCLYYLEHYTLTAVSTKVEQTQVTSQRLAWACHAMILLLPLLSLAYTVTKLVLILVRTMDSFKHDLHIAYRILCVVGVASPIVELILGLLSFHFMWRLVHVLKLRRLLQEEQKKNKNSNANFGRLMKLAVPEYLIIGVGLVMLIISSLAQAVSPYLFGSVIDLAVRNSSLCEDIKNKKSNASLADGHCTLWPMSQQVLYLLGFFLVASTAAMIRTYCFNVAGERFVARLRKKVFASIVKQEMGFFDTTRTGELTNRLASDTTVIQNAVTENISILARYTLQMVASLALMFWISAKLTAVLISVVPLIIFGAVQYGRYLKKVRKQYQDKLALANTTAEEAISNIQTVKSFCNESKMSVLYDRDIHDSYGLGKVLALLMAGFSGFVFPLIYGACTLVLWYGGYLVFHGHLSPGKLTALMLYTLTLAMAFAFISNVYGEFMQAIGASVRIFELLDRVPTVANGDFIGVSFKGEILFQKVQFTYPSRPNEPVLKDVSFHVQQGQVVALVGPSGGGKSTIVNLIEHFYEIDSGRVILGGYDVKTISPFWFRKRVGIVSQEPVLFACSIKDNIAFGKEDATMEEIEDAARQANAHDFITSFEENYSTIVGERGVRLSGGQKQRIAIARALLLDPDILLLDEATSALDAESEHLVQEAIDRAMKGRTVLVIAHRLSTVRNASQVLVIDNGHIVESGTHNELVARDGVYKRLVVRQLMAAEGGPTSLSDQEIMTINKSNLRFPEGFLTKNNW